jgi:hypothetical protein
VSDSGIAHLTYLAFDKKGIIPPTSLRSAFPQKLVDQKRTNAPDGKMAGWQNNVMERICSGLF